MNIGSAHFGCVDNRFLAKSVGLLNPAQALLVHEEEPVRVALEKLRENKKGCVVIVDEEDKAVGVFSERDVMLKVILNSVDIDGTKISSIMTPNPETVEMTTTVAFALNLMSAGGFRHLPIVDEENFTLGMLSVKDIIDYIAAGLSEDLARVAS